VQKQTIGEAGN